MSLFTDAESPVITDIPIEISQDTDPGQPNTRVTWTPPTATDNIGPVTLTSNHEPGTLFNIGTHIVVYTARDQGGNMATASFEIKVIGKFHANVLFYYIYWLKGYYTPDQICDYLFISQNLRHISDK